MHGGSLALTATGRAIQAITCEMSEEGLCCRNGFECSTGLATGYEGIVRVFGVPIL